MVFVSWQIDYNRRGLRTPSERNFIKKMSRKTIKNKEGLPGHRAVSRVGIGEEILVELTLSKR